MIVLFTKCTCSVLSLIFVSDVDIADRPVFLLNFLRFFCWKFCKRFAKAMVYTYGLCHTRVLCFCLRIRLDVERRCNQILVVQLISRPALFVKRMVYFGYKYIFW